jgi:AraC-like DNA-binding protein
MHIVKTQPEYLSKHIKCIYSVYTSQFQSAASTHRRLPDGTLDLVFNLGSDVLLSDDGITFSPMPDVALTGLYGKRKFIQYRGAVHLVGVVLQPGFAHLFVNDTLEHFKDSLLDATLLFGREIYFVLEQIKGMAGELERHRLLERFLLGYLDGKDEGRYSEKMFTVARQIQRSEGDIGITTLCKETFMSERTFRRKFNECVGMGAKQYAAITRIKSFSKRYELSASSYTDIFSGLGYTDQSHFARDFQKIVGTSPTSYFTHLNAIGAGFMHLI